MGVYIEVVDIVVAIVAIIIKTFNIEDNQLQHYENVCVCKYLCPALVASVIV